MMTNERTDKTTGEQRQHPEADRRPDPASTDVHRDEMVARLRQRFKIE
jgi:hypothetical protein